MQKSPITLVYECASKMKFNVEFSVQDCPGYSSFQNQRSRGKNFQAKSFAIHCRVFPILNEDEALEIQPEPFLMSGCDINDVNNFNFNGFTNMNMSDNNNNQSTNNINNINSSTHQHHPSTTSTNVSGTDISTQNLLNSNSTTSHSRNTSRSNNNFRKYNFDRSKFFQSRDIICQSKAEGRAEACKDILNQLCLFYSGNIILNLLQGNINNRNKKLRVKAKRIKDFKTKQQHNFQNNGSQMNLSNMMNMGNLNLNVSVNNHNGRGFDSSGMNFAFDQSMCLG